MTPAGKSPEGGMPNPWIARYYCLPHLLVPLPFLAVGPALVAVGFGKWVGMVVGAAILLLMAPTVLARLPDLFQKAQREKYSIERARSGAGLVLLMPMVLAVMAAEAGTKSTVAMAYEGLATAPVGGYYWVQVPRAPDFSRIEIVAEGTRRATRGNLGHWLTTATHLGFLGGRRVMLVEQDDREYSWIDSDEELKRQMADFRDDARTRSGLRFEAIGRLGGHVVRVRSWTDLGLPERDTGDLLLEWNVDRPEHTKAMFVLMALAAYLLFYGGIVAGIPLLCADDDAEAVARFRRIGTLRERLFGFVR